MFKTIVKKVPDEDVYYNWDDELDLTEVKNDIVILGDRHYVVFGNDTPLDIVKGDFYDDDLDENGEVIGYDYETLPELDKICGGDWEETELRGYSQGDYCKVYYNKEKVSQGLLKELDIYIMGKVDEYTVQESEDEDDRYCVFIPHDVCWDGKEAICNFLGLKPEETTVLEDDGFEKVYKYKEVQQYDFQS